MSLTSLSVKEYLQRVADGTPTPGGGGVCALVGGLGAALCLMTAHLTIGKEKYRSAWAQMLELSHRVTKLAARLLELTEQDSAAYDKLLSALKLAQENEAQKKLRKESIQAAAKETAIVPLETLRTIAELIDSVELVVEKGNPNCLCDAAVAIQLIRAVARGAEYNIRANLSSITDENFSSRTRTEMISLRENIMQAVSRLEVRIELLMPSI
jgi:formiminotetrahydrofolate cyclodeaminase